RLGGQSHAHELTKSPGVLPGNVHDRAFFTTSPWLTDQRSAQGIAVSPELRYRHQVTHQIEATPKSRRVALPVSALRILVTDTAHRELALPRKRDSYHIAGYRSTQGPPGQHLSHWPDRQHDSKDEKEQGARERPALRALQRPRPLGLYGSPALRLRRPLRLRLHERLRAREFPLRSGLLGLNLLAAMLRPGRDVLPLLAPHLLP